MAKGEIKVGHITTSSVDYYMVLDAKTNQFKKQTNRPDNYDELEKKGDAYKVYKESDKDKIGFVVNSVGQVTANGAQLNSAKILKATLTNCTIQSANVGALIGGSITGATINGSTISGGTIKGGKISGGTIDGSTITGATITAKGMITCEGLTVSGKSYVNKPITFKPIDIKSGAVRSVINSSSGFKTPSSTTGLGGGGGTGGRVTVGGTITDSAGKACNYNLYVDLSSSPSHTHTIPEMTCERTGGTNGITSFHHITLKMDVLAAELSQSSDD